MLAAGDAFGELALLEQTTRSATVRASSAVEVLKLDRALFDAVVRSHPEVRVQLAARVRAHRLRDFLRLRSAFARLPGDVLDALISELETVDAGDGDTLLPAGPLYVVRDGRARVGEDGYVRAGDFFAGAADALDDLTLLAIPPATFKRLLADDPDFRRRVEQRVASYEYRTARACRSTSPTRSCRPPSGVATAGVDRPDRRGDGRGARSSPRAERRSRAAAADPPLPARLPARRGRLRRRLRWRWSAATSAAR